jgi:hypothetical protein
MGPGGSGGGTNIGLEFQASLDKALENFYQIDSEIAKSLEKRDRKFKVLVTTKKLIIETGSQKQVCVAMNTPSIRTITINSAAWMQIKNANAKEGLALHEFLSLEGLEKTGEYPISGKYFAAFDLNPYSANKVETQSEKAVAAAKAMYALNIQDSKNALFKAAKAVCTAGQDDEAETCTIEVSVEELGSVYKTPGPLSYVVTFIGEQLHNVQQVCPYCH